MTARLPAIIPLTHRVDQRGQLCAVQQGDAALGLGHHRQLFAEQARDAGVLAVAAGLGADLAQRGEGGGVAAAGGGEAGLRGGVLADALKDAACGEVQPGGGLGAVDVVGRGRG